MSKYPSIEKSARKCGATVLFCKKVKTLILTGSTKNSTKNKKKIKTESIKKILLITDCFIEQYDIDNYDEPEKRAYWFDLLKVNVNTQNNFFSLEFAYPEPTEIDIKNEIDPQNYIFQLTNKEEEVLSFYRIIIELIQRILTEQEMRDLVFFDDESLYDDDEYFEQYNFTPRGAFARFLILSMKKKNESLSQNVKESVAEYILMKYNNIYIKNEFCIENCLDILLSAIKPLRYVESISIPPFNKFIQVDSLNIISSFLKKASNLQHIEIRGPCLKSHFHDLCRSIENMGVFDNDNKGKRKSQCKITGITFDNLELDMKQIASIKTAAISGRLLSLGINNVKAPSNSKPTENDTIIDYTVDMLLTPHLTASLRILSLDGNQDIDIQKLLENSGSIEKLSLKNCGLEITHVFEALASNSTSIDSIDLSYNNCSNSDIDKAIMNLSSPLLRIDVNNVTWSDDCLINFLRGIVKIYEIPSGDEYERSEEEDYDEKTNEGHNLKDIFLNSEENVNSGLNSILVTLSLSYINTTKSEWQNVRTFFENNHKKLTIEQFSYNGNKISSHFIVFLRSMKRIRRLFLNNCPNFSQFSSTLATNFISKSSTLSELYIEKADASSFPEESSFSSFFKKCCDSISLRLIDAKMCTIGVDGLMSLSNLITKCKSRNLNQVAFDGTGVESFDDLEEFFAVCKDLMNKKNKKKSSRKSSSSSFSSSIKRLFIELPSYDLRILKVPESKIENLKGEIADLARKKNEKDDLWVSPYEFYVMQKNDDFPKFFHPKIASKMKKKIDREIEIERSLRKSGKNSYKQNSSSSYSQKRNSSKSSRRFEEDNDENSKIKAKSGRSNYGRSYRYGEFEDDRKKKGYLYVGKDGVSDSENDFDERKSKNSKSKRFDAGPKSKYDEEDDDFDVDVQVEIQSRRGKSGETRKKKTGFRPNDWSFPINSLDNVDEINDNLVIRLEDKFSLRQLISDVLNKNE